MLNGENNFKIKVNKEIKSRDAEFCQACNKCDTTYVYQAENINEILDKMCIFIHITIFVCFTT